MSTRLPAFAFYEKVRVIATEAKYRAIHGEIGAVLGRVLGNDGWRYAVHIYRDAEGWDLSESDLEPTGEHDVRETFYDGTSVRVSPSGDLIDE